MCIHPWPSENIENMNETLLGSPLRCVWPFSHISEPLFIQGRLLSAGCFFSSTSSAFIQNSHLRDALCSQSLQLSANGHQDQQGKSTLKHFNIPQQILAMYISFSCFVVYYSDLWPKKIQDKNGMVNIRILRIPFIWNDIQSSYKEKPIIVEEVAAPFFTNSGLSWPYRHITCILSEGMCCLLGKKCWLCYLPLPTQLHTTCSIWGWLKGILSNAGNG